MTTFPRSALMGTLLTMILPLTNAAPASLSDFQALAAKHHARLELATYPKTVDEVRAQTDAAIREADAALAIVVAQPAAQRTFASTFAAVDAITAQVSDLNSQLGTVAQSNLDAAVRDAANDATVKLSGWAVGVTYREDLYQVLQAVAAAKPALGAEEQRLVDFTMRDYRRAGLSLPSAERAEVEKLQKELAALNTEFAVNINQARAPIDFTAEELAGVPASFLESPGVKQPDGKYRVMANVTWHAIAIAENARSAEVRRRVAVARSNLAREKNVAVLQKLVALRGEIARRLGYASWADYQIETRMAKNSEAIAKFYKDLRPVVRKKALVDHKTFLDAKIKDTGDKKAKLYPWDMSFYKNRVMKDKYSVDSEKVAEYFPVKAVFDGLFKITASLYGIEFKDVTSQAKALDLPVWHPDVKLWSVTDKKSGELLGHIYTDLFPRPNKYNHAACWGLRSRKVWADGTVQKPLAALVTNFTKPTADKPSLMPHEEVETFFHEFGHALHNILTQTKYGKFSGAQVELDFVEAPSQMFENWVWDPQVLSMFARHYKTGKPLPKETLEGMKNAHTLGTGLDTEHQIYYGMVDQKYHTAPNGKIDTTKTGVDMLAQIELYPRPAGTYFQASFGHLVGYEGAYYGYLWSLVYAQDMFERFRKEGILNPAAGMYYRNKILGRGGSMDAADMLRDYLGREPKTDAFLRHLGLSK